MVQALQEEMDTYKSRLEYFKETRENNIGRQSRSLIMENNGSLSPEEEDKATSRSHVLASPHDHQSKIGSVFDRTENIKSRLTNNGNMISPLCKEKQHSDMELMKERFAKLLLGEDMSGGGKGVSSALALSNAITNLAASTFGEQRRLEPMSPEIKARWRKEIDWLLSVTDHIVELVPSKQKSKEGITMEIMVTKQRNDLLMNIPALRKLDAMLLDCLDNFKDQNEFYYASKDDKDSQNGRKDDKWWIPTPKVPEGGLSEVTRKWLQYQKDSVNQVLKAAMAINAQVLSEMQIPESYIDALPKNGRETLGDALYRSITDDYFDPDDFLTSMDLSSEHKILDLKNKMEASVIIWRRKMNSKDTKSTWSTAISMERREIFEDRAETILLILKHRFPGIPQSDLDINKIEFNRDVGHAILESYSRTIESLAFTVLSRIEDVMQADYSARNPSIVESTQEGLTGSENAKEEVEKLETPTSMKLLDVMGWNLDPEEKDEKKSSPDSDNDGKPLSKLANIITNTKNSYLEKLENLGGMKSPTSRH